MTALLDAVALVSTADTFTTVVTAAAIVVAAISALLMNGLLPDCLCRIVLLTTLESQSVESRSSDQFQGFPGYGLSILRIRYLVNSSKVFLCCV